MSSVFDLIKNISFDNEVLSFFVKYLEIFDVPKCSFLEDDLLSDTSSLTSSNDLDQTLLDWQRIIQVFISMLRISQVFPKSGE